MPAFDCICQTCNAAFRAHRTPKQTAPQFCSVACRAAASPPLVHRCEQCGTEFIRPDAGRRLYRFCSQTCSGAAHQGEAGPNQFRGGGRPRLVIVEMKACTVCGKTIVPRPQETRYGYANRKTCGPTCAAIANGRGHIGQTPHNKLPGLPQRTCKTCGNAFSPPHRKNPAIYCSRACHLDGVHRSNRGEKVERVEVRCPICGTVFRVVPSMATDRVHCSKACDSEARRRVRGETHPLFKPTTAMTCEVCGTVKHVKPSLVSRFRACSRRCASTFAKIEYPRRSSIELAVERVLIDLGESFEAQAVFRWYVVDFFLPARSLVLEVDGTYWHSIPKQQRIDKSKDAYLRNRGIAVVRLTEAAIRTDVEAAVAHALMPPPTA